MQMINKVEVLRSILFTEEDFNTIINKQDFPQFNEADISFMIEFKKIYELGEPQLRRFITKLDAEGGLLDQFTIDYYTSVLLAGPFGNLIRDILGDLDQHTYWKRLPDSIGQVSDYNHQAVNTAAYADSPQIDGPNRRTFANIPNNARVDLGKGIQATNGVFYSSLNSSTVVDSTYNKNKQSSPQKIYEQTQDGTIQQTPHGGYLVTDVSYLKAIQVNSQGIRTVSTKSLNSEDQRMLTERNVGTVIGEWTTSTTPNPQLPTTPNGSEFGPTSDSLDNISKNFKIQKQITDSGVQRMVELDLYGNEFDSDERRERILNIGGKQSVKNLNINTDVGQLGDVGDPNSLDLTQTTMAPFNTGGTPPGIIPPVPLATGANPKTPFQKSANPIPITDDGTIDVDKRNSFLRSLPEGKRNLNGNILMTSYGRKDDPTGDSNTRARRGFSNNLLQIGSLALSPDIYNYYACAIGSSVYIDGLLIGYYEDRTPASFNGQPYGLTIDVYDPGGKLGDIAKNAGPSSKLTFGPRRAQIRNS